VMDTGNDDEGIPFLVMELLEGESLASMLRRERVLSPGLSCWIASQVLAGLGAAHAQGVVHRDLKPGNIFIARQSDGSHKVKILDFGISKLGGDSNTMNVTAEGALVGTPNFMAPEQITGEGELDSRVDLYAVGVLLYRMVVGRLPFVGKTPDELYRKVLSGQVPSPRRRNPDLPPELEASMLKAMALDRNNRFQDAASFRAALHEIAPTLPGELPATTENLPPRAMPTASAGGSIELESAATVAAKPDARRAEAARRAAAGGGKGRRRALIAGLALIGAGLGGFAVYRGMGTSEPAVATPTGPPLRYGIIRYSSPDKIQAEHGRIVSYLQARLDRPVVLEVVANDKILTQKLFAGEIELAAFSAYSYIRAKRRGQGQLVLLAKPTTRGGPFYQGLIVTRADSGIRQLTDLRGKDFCYVRRGSTSGFLYPRALMRQVGLDPDKDLGGSHYGETHINTLRLLDDQEACAAAAVYSKALQEGDNLEIPAERFYQLAATERIPWDAYTVMAKTAPDDIRVIKEALLALDPDGSAAAEVFGQGQGEIIGFVAADDGDYDVVRKIEKYVKDEDIAANEVEPLPERLPEP